MLDPIELMAERAGELEQTYENNVMLPGLPAPGMLAFKAESNLPVPYTGGGGGSITPIQGQLVPNDNADPRLSQSTGMVQTGNSMTLNELDQVYDQATEEVLDALFLIDEDLNSGLDILSDTINTYNNKSMRLQVQQRDLMKDMGKIFRDWWEVSERERKRPDGLKTTDSQQGSSSTGSSDTGTTSSDGGGLGLGDVLPDFGGGDSKNDKPDSKNNPQRKKGFFNNIKDKARGAGKFLTGSKKGKIITGALALGAGYLGYKAFSDDREKAVMTPEQAKARRERLDTDVFDNLDSHKYNYDTNSFDKKGSEKSLSTTAADASTPVVLTPGQASIPQRTNDTQTGLDGYQMLGAAGLTALGGATAAQHLRNRQLKPQLNMNMPMNGPDVPKAKAPQLPNKVPKQGIASKLGSATKGGGKMLSKLGGPALTAAMGLYEGYNILNDDEMSQRDKTVQLSGVAGGIGGAAAGGLAGAAAGAMFGPGAVVMSPLLGLLGSGLGYFGGEALIENATSSVYDGVSSIGDYFGFGDDPTEDNVQTAAALTSSNINVDESQENGGFADKDNGIMPWMKDANGREYTKNKNPAVQRKVEAARKRKYMMQNPNYVPSTPKANKVKQLKEISDNTKKPVTTNPVTAVTNLNKQNTSLNSEVNNMQSQEHVESKKTETTMLESIFKAAATVMPGVGIANALYSNTGLSDMFSSDEQQPTVDSGNPQSERMSKFGKMAEMVKGAAGLAYDYSPIGMISNMFSSPSATTSQSNTNTIMGSDEQADISNDPATSSMPNVDTVQVTANAVEVMPTVESSERSNFTTIKEVTAPVVDKENQQPIIVQAPAPKPEPKPKPQIVKQVVQPRPTIDDTPIMLGNGGMGLIGNSIV